MYRSRQLDLADGYGRWVRSEPRWVLLGATQQLCERLMACRSLSEYELIIAASRGEETIRECLGLEMIANR